MGHCRELLRMADLFGQPTTFNYKQNSYFKTAVGGVSSILLIFTMFCVCLASMVSAFIYPQFTYSKQCGYSGYSEDQDRLKVYAYQYDTLARLVDLRDVVEDFDSIARI